MNNFLLDLPTELQCKIIDMKIEIEESENNNNMNEDENDEIICIECGDTFTPDEIEEFEYKICRDCLIHNHSLDLDD